MLQIFCCIGCCNSYCFIRDKCRGNTNNQGESRWALVTGNEGPKKKQLTCNVTASISHEFNNNNNLQTLSR